MTAVPTGLLPIVKPNYSTPTGNESARAVQSGREARSSRGRATAPAHRLVTIPISHYCEKARWALDRAGIAYREERHVQLVHRAATRRAGGGWTAPVLVTPEGVLGESAEIVAYTDRAVPPGRRLYPPAGPMRNEVHDLERWFDAELGPHARRWIYFQLLPHPNVAMEFNCAGVPGWERRAFPVVYPLVSRYIARHLKISPASAARSEKVVWETFDGVADRLSDGRRYLCADAFSAADLTFAALAAAVVLPVEYGTKLPQPEAVPPEIARDVRAFRDHPAGAFALRLFREERRATDA